jgi:hypothetical protein
VTVGLVTRGLVSGGVATAPSITSVDPTTGSQLSDKHDPVAIQVTNESGLPYALCVKFTGESRAFVIYDTDRGFYHPFTHSTTDGVGGFVLRQDGGWQDDVGDMFLGGVS